MTNKKPSPRERIIAELERQREIEGDNDTVNMMLRVLDCCESDKEWSAMINVGHHRYGVLSYEVHRFYYPSSLLLKIIDKFSTKENQS